MPSLPGFPQYILDGLTRLDKQDKEMSNVIAQNELEVQRLTVVQQATLQKMKPIQRKTGKIKAIEYQLSELKLQIKTLTKTIRSLGDANGTLDEQLTQLNTQRQHLITELHSINDLVPSLKTLQRYLSRLFIQMKDAKNEILNANCRLADFEQARERLIWQGSVAVRQLAEFKEKSKYHLECVQYAVEHGIEFDVDDVVELREKTQRHRFERVLMYEPTDYESSPECVIIGSAVRTNASAGLYCYNIVDVPDDYSTYDPNGLTITSTIDDLQKEVWYHETSPLHQAFSLSHPPGQ